MEEAEANEGNEEFNEEDNEGDEDNEEITKTAMKTTKAMKKPTKTAMKAMKKGMKAMKKGKADHRSAGYWLWVGVTVGKGKNVWTHGNGLKRVTFNLLPRPADAPDGKPRGAKALMKVIKTHIKTKTHLVFDKWSGTIKAVKDAGYHSKPPVNHSQGFRDRVSGFHSNDVESENNRIKRFLRKRYGKLCLGRYKVIDNDTVLDLYEYAFRVNVGHSFETYMMALRESNLDELVVD